MRRPLPRPDGAIQCVYDELRENLWSSESIGFIERDQFDFFVNQSPKSLTGKRSSAFVAIRSPRRRAVHIVHIYRYHLLLRTASPHCSFLRYKIYLRHLYARSFLPLSTGNAKVFSVIPVLLFLMDPSSIDSLHIIIFLHYLFSLMPTIEQSNMLYSDHVRYLLARFIHNITHLCSTISPRLLGICAKHRRELLINVK